MKAARLEVVWCLSVLMVQWAAMEVSAVTREQIIPIEKGWNAVFLEVHPENPEPSNVFGGTPVEIAAALYRPVTPAQFATNPSADLLRQTGWGVWYADRRADAFLSSLHSIYGQRAYLIYASANFVWKVTGTVLPPEIVWAPDSFNFVGFAVRPQAGPTFAQFFSGSKAHQMNRIYRLVGGTWKRVADPSAEAMRSGEAFWIYCAGASKFQGPLKVETTTRKGLTPGVSGDDLRLRNQANYPVTATIEHVPGTGSPVPLSLVITALGGGFPPTRAVSTPLPEGAWSQRLPALEQGETLKVPFEARAGSSHQETRASILKISSDAGTEIYIPVFSRRRDLEEK